MNPETIEDTDEIREALRPCFAKLAKEHIWDDEGWDLFVRSKIHEIAFGDWSEEDLLVAATFLDFDDENTRWRLKTEAEWEPEIPTNDTIIRRYITFDKFISLITNGGFWMSNIRNFRTHLRLLFQPLQ